MPPFFAKLLATVLATEEIAELITLAIPEKKPII
jgi:hypothetical protein